MNIHITEGSSPQSKLTLFICSRLYCNMFQLTFKESSSGSQDTKGKALNKSQYIVHIITSIGYMYNVHIT